MSDDSFKDFMSSLGSDEDLQKALKERFGDLSDEIPADDLIDFAEDQGYSFTVEDASRELSESELEGVTGGTYLKYDYDEAQTFENVTLNYSLDTNTFNFIKIG